MMTQHWQETRLSTLTEENLNRNIYKPITQKQQANVKNGKRIKSTMMINDKNNNEYNNENNYVTTTIITKLPKTTVTKGGKQ